MKYFFLALISVFVFCSIIPEFLRIYWPNHIENKLLFQVATLQIFHIITYIFVNIGYAIIYHLKHPFFEQFKVEKYPWPWEQDHKKWVKLRNNTILNFCIQIIIGTVLAYMTANRNRLYNISKEQLPTNIEILWQLIFCLFIEDLLFYVAHRILHFPILYRFHKQHHNYTVTISIAGEYTHPVEYICGNLIPFAAGPSILGPKMHLMTICVWIIIRVYKTLSTHSGYVFPWEIFQYLPYVSQSEFHSYHHSHNMGNYGGMLTLWDKILHTSDNYITAKNVNNYGMLKLKNH